MMYQILHGEVCFKQNLQEVHGLKHINEKELLVVFYSLKSLKFD